LPLAALPVAVRWLRTAGPCPVARVEDGATGLAPGSGPTDVVLSAKWRFLEDASRHLAFAFTPALRIPTGTRSSEQFLRPGQEFWSLDLRFAVVKDWSPRWSTNLAVAQISDGFCARPGIQQGAAGRNADTLRTFVLSVDANF